MAIKITEQRNVIVVRRWKYSTERKRSLPTQVYSVSGRGVPDKLPEDVVAAHNIDEKEQQTFIDFVANRKKEQEKSLSKYYLNSLTRSLSKAKDSLLDPEIKGELTLEEYEELSETVNEIKKLITKNKNALKRKQK